MVAIATPPERQLIGPGIGASEIAAVLGLHPYKSPLRLWQEKVGEAPPFEGNDFTEWGLAVEPALLAWYGKKKLPAGMRMDRPTASVYHQSHEWARCTPDAFVIDANNTPTMTVQAKNAAFWSGRRWDNGPPDEVQLQCQWEMFVTGLSRADAIASLGGMPPESWTVYRDDAIISDLLAAATKFWKLVQDRTPPAIDHSEDWAAYFAAKLSKAQGRGVVAPSSPDIDEMATALRASRASSKALERRQEELVNRLRGYMADCGADAIETAEGLITWHERAGSIAWKAIAEELVEKTGIADADLARIVEDKRGNPTRTFAVPRSWGKEH